MKNRSYHRSLSKSDKLYGVLFLVAAAASAVIFAAGRLLPAAQGRQLTSIAAAEGQQTTGIAAAEGQQTTGIAAAEGQQTTGIAATQAFSSPAGDITLSESLETCPLFLQGDPRWGNIPYGQSNIEASGCGPTCLSMVLYSLTGDQSLTPDTLAGLATEGGYYVPGSGTAWSFLEELPPRYGVFVHQNTVWNQQMMKVYLDDSKLLICAMGPGDFTDQGHFIVIRGYSDKGFFVNDPFSRENSSQEWDYDTLFSQCRHIWAFERIGEK